MAEVPNNNFLGVSTEGWEKIGTEFLCDAIAPLNFIRTAYNFRESSASDIFQQVLIGSIGLIPTFGSLARVPFLNKAALKLGAKFSNNLREALSSINTKTGGIQELMNLFGVVNTVSNGGQFLWGLTQWSGSNEEERTETLIEGIRFSSFFGLPNHYRIKAREKAAAVISRDQKSDHLETHIAGMRLFPPTEDSIKFRYQPQIRDNNGALEFVFEHDNPYVVMKGIPRKTKFWTLFDQIRRNFPGGNHALKSGNIELRNRVLAQACHVSVAKVGIKKVRVEGLEHLEKLNNNGLLACHTHESMVDSLLLQGLFASMRRADGSPRFETAITGKRIIQIVPGYDPIYGLASPGTGPFFIPVAPGQGASATKKVVSYLSKIRNGVQRAVLYFTPGHRTVRSPEDFKNGNNLKIYEPRLGVFNASARSGKSIVHFTIHYTEDGTATVRFIGVSDPNDFQVKPESLEPIKLSRLSRIIRSLPLYGKHKKAQDLEDAMIAAKARMMHQDAEDRLRQYVASSDNPFKEYVAQKFEAKSTGALEGV